MTIMFYSGIIFWWGLYKDVIICNHPGGDVTVAGWRGSSKISSSVVLGK